MLCKIEIKNYRCFSDEAPVVFDLSEGFTAIVGPNNSGKSTLFRLIYELRNLWSHLDSAGGLGNAMVGNRIDVGQILGVDDANEIFCDANDRDLTITFNFTSVMDSDGLKQITLRAARSEPQYWRVSSAYRGDGSVINAQKRNLSTIDDQSKLLVFNNSPNIRVREAVDLFHLLNRCMYVSAYRNVINEGAGRYYDLSVGTAFIQQWNIWKSGQQKAQMRTIGKITQDIQKIFGYEQLDIAASHDDKKLVLTINDSPYKNYEIGAGLSQFLMVFGNAAIYKPSFILIDEPELNLHPALQIDFLTVLRNYSTFGVIYSTHSIGLARSMADRIYCTKMDSSKSLFRKYESFPTMPEFLGEMSFSMMREFGFEKLLLVEGPKDVNTVRQFLRKLKKDHKVLILPLGGDRLANDKQPNELAELKRIVDDVHVLVDSERTAADQAPLPMREAFSSLCEKLGFHVHMTSLRALENYFTERAVKAALGNEYQALTPYQLLSDVNKPWRKTQNWAVAAEMTAEELLATDVGEFLNGI